MDRIFSSLKAHSNLAQFLCTMPKHDCPPSPLRCWTALTLLPVHLSLSMVTSCNYGIMLREHDCNLTDFMAYLGFLWTQREKMGAFSYCHICIAYAYLHSCMCNCLVLWHGMVSMPGPRKHAMLGMEYSVSVLGQGHRIWVL